MSVLPPEIQLLALQAAAKAGEAIRPYYYDKHTEVQLKADDSPVTSADLHANRIINEFLSRTNIPIISEENANIQYEKRKNWKSYWLVDPLDGTKEFLKRNGEFTINIAYCEEKTPLYGIIAVPEKGLLYIGDTTLGEARRITLNQNWTPKDLMTEGVPLFPAKNPSSSLNMAVSRSHLDPETKNLAETIANNGFEVQMIQAGSALKFCLLAEGEADLYARFSPTMEWDTAAGQALCEALGYEIRQIDLRKEMNYNKRNLRNPGFVIAHPDLLSLLNEKISG